MGFPLFLVVLLGASLGLAQQAQAKNPPTSAWHPVSDILNSTATDAACKTDIANEECILKPSILGGTVPGRRRPQYLMPVEVKDNLVAVRRVLALAGYERTYDPAEADLVWAWKTPFWAYPDEPALTATYNYMPNLRKDQKVNQILGLDDLTRKQVLALLSHNLSFIPKTFKMPEEYDAWQKFARSEEGKGMSWLKKFEGHRGVQVVSVDDASVKQADPSGERVLVQQLVRPWLIDGRLWDIGIYVSVPSVDPLRVYAWDGALVRFCRKKYTLELDPNNSQTYIIQGDYLLSFDIPPLKPLLNMQHDSGAQTMTLAVVMTYLASQGLNTSDLWLQLQSATSQLFSHFSARAAVQTRAVFPKTDLSSYFTMYRLDWMVDEKGKLYLLEANLSPGLSIPHYPQLYALYERVTWAHLSLNGLTPGGLFYPGATEQERAFLHNPDQPTVLPGPGCEKCALSAAKDGCNSELECKLCGVCLSPSERELLRRIQYEAHHGKGFNRVYPPPAKLRAWQEAHGIDTTTYASDSDLERLQDAWIKTKCEMVSSLC